MQTLIWLIFILTSIGIVSYFRMTLLNASVVVFCLFVLGNILGIIGQLSLFIFLLIAVPLNIDSIRKQYLSTRILQAFKNVMPDMSSTEKEAIDAGSVWWDGEIFSGNPNWQNLHSIPKARLTSEEQAFLEGPVEEACKMYSDWETTHKQADISEELWQYLKDNKFFAMIIKKEYGGLDFSAYAQSRVLQKLSSLGGVLSSTVGVPNSLGPGELLTTIWY